MRQFSLLALPLIAAIALACGGNGAAPATGDEGAAATTTTTAETAATSTPAATTTTAILTPPTVPTEVASRRDTPARQLLIAAIQSTSDLPAYRFESEITVRRLSSMPVTVSEVSFTFRGAADPATNSAEISFDFTDLIAALAESSSDPEAAALTEMLFGTEPLQFRFVGDTAYLSGPLITALLDVDTTWISFAATLDESSHAVGALGLSQFRSRDDLLAFLDDVYSVEALGNEDVRGVDTVHYSGVIALATLLEQLNPDQFAQIESRLGINLEDHLGDAPLDVWIDDQGYIRRILLVTDFSDFGGVGRYTEETVGAITLSYELYDVGETILIEPPPFADVTSFDGAFLEDVSTLTG
jgi:hypothetical protein